MVCPNLRKVSHNKCLYQDNNSLNRGTYFIVKNLFKQLLWLLELTQLSDVVCELLGFRETYISKYKFT